MNQKRIVSIHQPAFLPWLGYIHKIIASDVFVIFDDVLFEKNSFINRNKVAAANGPIWLTVPICGDDLSISAIKDLSISDSRPWRRKHLSTIEQSYRKRPFFDVLFPELEKVYGKNQTGFYDFFYDLFELMLQSFNIKTKIVRSSDLAASGRKSDLVLDICRILGADIYISGVNGRDYLQEKDFSAKSISIVYQEYAHPTYEQGRGEFVPYLSWIDLFFNMGPEGKNLIIEQNLNPRATAQKETLAGQLLV